MLFDLEKYTADSMYKVESSQAYKCLIKNDSQSKDLLYEFICLLKGGMEEDRFENFWAYHLHKNQLFKEATEYAVTNCSEEVPFNDEYAKFNNLPYYRGILLVGYYKKSDDSIIGLALAHIVGDIYKTIQLYCPKDEDKIIFNENIRATIRYLLDTQSFEAIEVHNIYNIEDYPEDHFLFQMAAGVEYSENGDGSGKAYITKLTWKEWFDNSEEEFYNYESGYI